MRSEEELIRQATSGNEQALTELLEELAPSLRRRLADGIPKRWRSLLSEDDVLQQTYVDAFRDIRQFMGENRRSFVSWLETLARRNLLDALKMLEAEKRGTDKRRIEPQSGEQSLVALYEVLGATESTPSRGVARHEACNCLQKAIETLPDMYRRVVEMYDLQHMGIEEVTSELGRSSGAVYMLRARAHRMLSEIMGTASDYLSRRS